jgi:indole-3-glycerol phosphate synthase
VADILTRILAAKREEIEGARRRDFGRGDPPPAEKADAPRGFHAALARALEDQRPAVIAEIKRASPSRGLIRPDFDPTGSRRATPRMAPRACPSSPIASSSADRGRPRRGTRGLQASVLRKDFIVDPYQVYEARSWGADCILLIMDAAPDSELGALCELARSIGSTSSSSVMTAPSWSAPSRCEPPSSASTTAT